MQVQKQQLEPDMEQLSKLGKEYKPEFFHPVYFTHTFCRAHDAKCLAR